MSINDRYSKISRNRIDINIKIKSFLPKPDESDYNRGFITRYFVQKCNDSSSPIFEVSEDTFFKYNTSPTYIGTKLSWRISGPVNRTFDKLSSVYDNGVVMSNTNAIRLASNKIKNLKLYLPNLLQFHK